MPQNKERRKCYTLILRGLINANYTEEKLNSEQALTIYRLFNEDLDIAREYFKKLLNLTEEITPQKAYNLLLELKKVKDITRAIDDIIIEADVESLNSISKIEQAIKNYSSQREKI